MISKELAEQAKKEYSLPENVIRPGGVNGQPFWNTQATQFTYAPSFDLAPALLFFRYLYEAVGCDGVIHSFEADSPIASLCPIWDELPDGQISLIVTAINEDGSRFAVSGARTFHKCSPFTGNYPPRARSYREAAAMAFEYGFELPLMQHWLTGKPDTDYWLYLYPSKMTASIINSMIAYGKLRPERAETAKKIAVNAADYLLSITEPKGSPLEGLPPTYYKHKSGKIYQEDVEERIDQNMLIYPCNVGMAYLALFDATGEKKYYDAAIAISDWYRDHVQPNGSWYLMVYTKSGKPSATAYCLPFEIATFLRSVYDRTGEKRLLEITENCDKYVRDVCYKNFNWEGQFEDSVISSRYSNLAHSGARAYIYETVRDYSDDPERIAEAEECMRFVEDQFVLWDKKPVVRPNWLTNEWHVPSGLEQYAWYVPINDSTADIMKAFGVMYKATGKRLYLEKAKALADSITNMQNPENGFIPTHWNTSEPDKECGTKFWVNCLFSTALRLVEFADLIEDETDERGDI